MRGREEASSCLGDLFFATTTHGFHRISAETSSIAIQLIVSSTTFRFLVTHACSRRLIAATRRSDLPNPNTPDLLISRSSSTRVRRLFWRRLRIFTSLYDGGPADGMSLVASTPAAHVRRREGVSRPNCSTSAASTQGVEGGPPERHEGASVESRGDGARWPGRARRLDLGLGVRGGPLGPSVSVRLEVAQARGAALCFSRNHARVGGSVSKEPA